MRGTYDVQHEGGRFGHRGSARRHHATALYRRADQVSLGIPRWPYDSFSSISKWGSTQKSVEIPPFKKSMLGLVLAVFYWFGFSSGPVWLVLKGVRFVDSNR